MRTSIRQIATAAIALSLLMSGRPSHGEAVLPGDHVGVIVHHSLKEVQFWIFAENIRKWVPHVVEARHGMVAVKCDYIPNGNLCSISFDGGVTYQSMKQTVRYSVSWNDDTEQYVLEPLR
jgi:hypothetical protein